MKFRFIALMLIAAIKAEVVFGQNNIDQFIGTVTDQVIIPSLEASFEAAEHFDQSTKKLCDDPNSNNILETQSRWANAMKHWSSVRLFNFGPMIEDNVDLKIHYLPIRKNQIKANLNNNLTSAEKLPVSARGLATIEYLLFDREKSQQEIADEFLNRPERCNYLLVLSQQLVKDNEKILSEWSISFAELFKGKDGKITQAEALEKIFRSIISYFEATIKNRLSRPAGINTEQPLPYKSESWRSGASTDSMLAGIEKFEQLLYIEQGLSDFLEKNDQLMLAKALNRQTENLKKSIIEIKPDLFTAVTESPEKVKVAYTDYLKLTDTFKQSAKALNIQIGFNDQDGD